MKLNKASEVIRLRVALIIGACLVLGFMVADFILLPDAMHNLYIFDRLLLQLPIILIMVVASFWRQFSNCKHYLFTFLLLSLTYSNYWLIWACWRDFQFVFPYEGTILYAFFCVFALGIPFKLAFFAAAFNIVGFLSLMWAAPVYGDRVGISIAFVCASLFICAYAKYRLDRSVSLLEQSNDRLLKLSKFDPLSDLLNRRALRELSVKLLSVSKRHKVSMAVFMLDLDDFKKYNDSFGHQEGDEAIKLQADIMRTVFKRETDILGRYGGEEFIVVVSEVDKQRVVSLCNALLAQWKEAKLPHAKDAKHSIMSCSIGAVLATDVKDVKLDTLIDKADQALYEAKEKGKACFELQELA